MKNEKIQESPDEHITLAEWCKIHGIDHRHGQRLKKAGMPTFTAKRDKHKHGSPPTMVNRRTADEWAFRNGYLSKNSVGQSDGKTVDLDPSPVPLEDQGLVASLGRIREAEARAGRAYKAAQSSKDAIAIRNAHLLFIQAQKQLVETEKLAGWRAEVREQVWEECLEAFKEWSLPVREYLEGFPRMVSARANVGDPRKAEEAIREAINNGLLPLMAGKVRKP